MTTRRGRRSLTGQFRRKLVRAPRYADALDDATTGGKNRWMARHGQMKLELRAHCGSCGLARDDIEAHRYNPRYGFGMRLARGWILAQELNPDGACRVCGDQGVRVAPWKRRQGVMTLYDTADMTARLWPNVAQSPPPTVSGLANEAPSVAGRPESAVRRRGNARGQRASDDQNDIPADDDDLAGAAVALLRATLSGDEEGVDLLMQGVDPYRLLPVVIGVAHEFSRRAATS